MAASTTKKSPAPKASSATIATPSQEPVTKPRVAKAKAAKATPAATMQADSPGVVPLIGGAPGAPTREAIALRAYDIWRAEGGHALDNWLRAERELGA